MRYKGPVILVVPPKKSQQYFWMKFEYVRLMFKKRIRFMACGIKSKPSFNYEYRMNKAYGLFNTYNNILVIRI